MVGVYLQQKSQNFFVAQLQGKAFWWLLQNQPFKPFFQPITEFTNLVLLEIGGLNNLTLEVVKTIGQTRIQAFILAMMIFSQGIARSSQRIIFCRH